MKGKLKILLKKNKGSTTNILGTDQSNNSSSDVNGAESIELNSQVTTSASEEIRIEESQQTSDNLMREETNKENGIRNILLIGKTGNGKSTLANVLVDNSEFPEGKYGVSKTKEVRSKVFKIEGIKYRVVDTVGISDTKSSPDEVLKKLADACWYIKEELNQVLFVVSGRFTEEEISYYNLLKVIFDESIVNYTTIVRTNFPHFKKKADCEEDIKIMIDNGGELTEVIKTCKERIIHVDNPPIDVEGERLKCNKEDRKVSKGILLKNLIKFDETHKSKNFYRVRHENLENFIREREKIIKQIKKIKSELLRYGYGKKFVDCSDELVEGSVGISNLIQPDNYPMSNAGGDIVKSAVKMLSIPVNYVLDEKENQLIEKFKNKIKEDRKNQEKYLSQLNFEEKEIGFPGFSRLEYIELSIERLQEELKNIKEEKEKYEMAIKDWNNRLPELEEKLKLQSDSSNELSSETRNIYSINSGV